MPFTVDFNPDAQTDIQNAIYWYNSKQPGLGKRFYSEIKQNLLLLKKMPYLFAVRYDDIRCLPLAKFPYMIHYRINRKGQAIKVEAVFHTSMDPEKWHNRIR